eukprot:TRINITY_DN2170_c0_g1_i1.p1 TRINITY_DN2170_c0_g1~~TRINITY_DN2170_c0_g1_i1.p1  ORF type:complete len:254 (+),score=50.75 TRINITY_DN2170_c0_g1_i1:69-830(+)
MDNQLRSGESADGYLRPMKAHKVFPKVGERIATVEDIQFGDPTCCGCQCCSCSLCSCTGGCFLCNAWMNPHTCSLCSCHGCCGRYFGAACPCTRICDTDLVIERCDCFAAGDLAPEAKYVERQELNGGYCSFYLMKPVNAAERFNRVVHENGVEVSFALPIPGKGLMDFKFMHYFDQLYFDKVTAESTHPCCWFCCPPDSVIMSNKPCFADCFPCCYSEPYSLDKIIIPRVANPTTVADVIKDVRRKRISEME